MKRPDKEIGKVLHGIESYPQRYQETILEYITYLESQLQPRKTVADAVDYFDGVWPLGELDILFWSETYECYGDYSLKAEGAYKVCTREEFEAEVERRKGEEWTHKSKGGKLCKVVYEDNETQLVYFSDGSRSCYWDAEHFAVKRKTISKAEAWNKAVNEDVSPFYIIENYEVK